MIPSSSFTFSPPPTTGKLSKHPPCKGWLFKLFLFLLPVLEVGVAIFYNQYIWVTSCVEEGKLSRLWLLKPCTFTVFGTGPWLIHGRKVPNARNILADKKYFCILRTGGMMYLFDQVVYANNVMNSKHLFLYAWDMRLEVPDWLDSLC